MLVSKEDPSGGPEEGDGSGFIRVAAWWCFALATLFYVSLVFVVFTVELFAGKRILLCICGLIIYIPAIAIWLLTRWFNARR